MLLFPTITIRAEEKTAPNVVLSSELSVGYGVAVKKNIRVGNEYKNGNKNVTLDGIPLIQANYGRFTLGPQGATIRAVGDAKTSASVVLNISGDRYEAQGMKGRKKGVFAGALFKWSLFSLLATRDVENKSQGWSTQISYNEVFVVTKELLLRSSLYMKWNDQDYANYYYGVKPEEATAIRPAYETSGYFTPGIGLLSIYMINKEFQFMMGLNFEFLSEKVQNSPTVINQDLVAGGFAGLNYRF